ETKQSTPPCQREYLDCSLRQRRNRSTAAGTLEVCQRRHARTALDRSATRTTVLVAGNRVWSVVMFASATNQKASLQRECDETDHNASPLGWEQCLMRNHLSPK